MIRNRLCKRAPLHSEIHLLEIYTFVLLHPHRPTWTWKIWVVLSEWSVCFSYFHCDTSLATFSHTILTWFIFEPSPQCFIISLGKRTVESESEKVSLSPHHSVVLWFVMMVCYDIHGWWHSPCSRIQALQSWFFSPWTLWKWVMWHGAVLSVIKLGWYEYMTNYVILSHCLVN